MRQDPDMRDVGREMESDPSPPAANRRQLSRRRFIGTGAAAGASLAAVVGPYTVANSQRAVAETAAEHAAAQTQPGTAQGYEFFTPFQADIVIAAAGRLIPAD